MAQALIPHSIRFTFDNSTINIIDAQLSLSFQNGTTYQECMSKKGIKSYVLTKGNYVTQDGDITLSITKTPNGTEAASITKIQQSLEHIQKNDTPSTYKKTIAAIIENSSNVKFLEVRFEGYPSELVIQAPDSTGFLTYLATFTVYDPETINITN